MEYFSWLFVNLSLSVKLYTKLVWVINRLSVMGWKEVSHRMVELINIYIAKLPLKNRAKQNFLNTKNFINDNEILLYSDFVRNCNWSNVEADKISLLENHYNVQSFDWTFEDNQSWFQCPATGFNWPRKFFHNINFRIGGENGDVRIVWEASRLQQLVVLAYIADTDTTHSDKAIKIYLSQFDSWYQNNSPYQGPHYISVMECALRVISVCFASSMLKGKIEDDSYWLRQSNLITSHVEVILERLSLHSSSGNHTLTEAVGLIFAGKFYSKHPRAKKWSIIGEKLFSDEFIRQTNPDGSGIEQTTWYLKFIFELAVITMPLINSENKSFLQDRVDTVHLFLSEMMVDDKLVDYGDSDSGFAVSRYLNFITYDTSKSQNQIHFQDAGLVKIKHGKAVVFFDYGSLGMPPSYGHGHADCLSVNFYYNNSCVLGDRGTYTYNGDEKLRKYFRSTSAHNTVVINQQDQSTQSSRFMWKNDVESELVWFESDTQGTYVLAKHFGYVERFGCIHWRGIHISCCGCLYVWDFVEGNTEKIEGYWHLDPNVELIGDKLIHDDFELTVINLPETSDSFINDIEIPIGVTSDMYGSMLPSYTLKTKLLACLGQITVFSEYEQPKSAFNNVAEIFQKKMLEGKNT